VRSIVGENDLRAAVSTYDILVDELCDMVGVRDRQCTWFRVFCQVVGCGYDVSVVSFREWERPDDVDSDAVKGGFDTYRV
jgi:hypothetical protein